MQSGLFRARALAKMTAPEQLDQIMRVTSPRSWLVLIGLGAMVLAAVAWGIFGSIPRTVAGQGVLTRAGGVYPVVATSTGLVEQMIVTEGEMVKQGQVLALVRTLPEANASSVAPPAQSQASGERSPATGQILELLARRGQLLRVGDPIASVDFPDMPMHAYVYVPAGSGSAISPGMEVQISPAIAPAEQFGYVAGAVVSVTQFAVTQGAAHRVLQNDELVKTFLANGPVLLVDVLLTVDPGTPSGYKWSSSRGPDLILGAGSLITANVVISTQRPLDLVVARPRTTGQ
jgi:hypothetical protein